MVTFSGLDRRGAGACGTRACGAGVRRGRGEHRALPQRDTAICADGGHRPGLHPEPRQAARPRGAAMGDGGASREARRPTIAPYRDGTAPRGAATGHAMEARPRGTTEGAQMGEATGHGRGAGKESARLSLGRFAPKWGFW